MWLERGENTIDPNQECPPRFTVNEKGIVRTMIGIDPHKTTHTAVAIDDDENVLDEFTLRTSSVQAKRLTDWASGFEKQTGCNPRQPSLNHPRIQQKSALCASVLKACGLVV